MASLNRIYSVETPPECEVCGATPKPENDVETKYWTIVGKWICCEKPETKPCSSKIEEFVEEWSESQGQVDLSEFS